MINDSDIIILDESEPRGPDIEYVSQRMVRCINMIQITHFYHTILQLFSCKLLIRPLGVFTEDEVVYSSRILLGGHVEKY